MRFKTGVAGGTTVTFAGGSLAEEATVLFAQQFAGHWVIVTDTSPFHPVSPSWPDQPGDRGWLLPKGGPSVVISDSLTGMLRVSSGELLIGEDAASIPRGEHDVEAVVIHLCAPDHDLTGLLGTTLGLQVDKQYRDSLSLQHTGVPLAPLALNRCAAAFWTKDSADLDGLGAPNLDKAAVVASKIGEDVSTDEYRIGKSLRKKGFDPDSFVAALDLRTETINRHLAAMLANATGPITLEPKQGPLDGRRTWSCDLDNARVSMPCGGTHLGRLDEIGKITVNLRGTEEGFIMETRTTSGK